MTQTVAETIVEAKGIVNRFGAQTVHDGASLALGKGEIVGFVGGSGSGKSVLLRTLLGLNRPAAGQALVCGKDIYALDEEEKKEVQKKWGVLFQDGALFSALTVADNIGVPLREHTRLPQKDIDSLAAFKLSLVGLAPETAGKKPSELSGGMARRAALARALALDPVLLFLDEPTAGLDPAAANAFDGLIRSLRAALGLSVLIITHDLDTLAGICDRIAMIVDKKIRTGTLAEMMRAEHPDIRAFFQGPRMHAVLQGRA